MRKCMRLITCMPTCGSKSLTRFLAKSARLGNRSEYCFVKASYGHR